MTRHRRDFTIQHASQAVREYDPEDPTRLRITCVVNIAIREDHQATHLKAEVDLGWKVLEETAGQRDETLLRPDQIVVPDGFKQASGQRNVFIGTLSKIPASFMWTSAYFPDIWSVAPDPQVRGSAVTEKK